MIKSKHLIALVTMVAVTWVMSGTASAAPADIPDWTDIDGPGGPPPFVPFGINPVTPTNILSTGGDFSYKKGKLKYKAKGSKSNTSISLEDALGPTTPLMKASVEVKKGKITVKGIDPLGNPKKKVTLVTAFFDEGSITAANFKENWSETDDLFGVSTFGITCVSTWNFCTNKESFYVAGEFGGDFSKIKVKGSKGGGATAVTTIPVPAAVWLFGSGLIGLVGMARRKKAS